MALTNLDKNNLYRLFEMINLNDQELNHKFVSLKENYSTYSKLELIAKQMIYLKEEATNILKNHELNEEINKISCNFKKVPGTYYYLYEINNQKVLSLISDNEWSTYDKFLGKVYYNYDCIFYIS
jgi:phosphoglycerate-specific signal transduction histidine kinase